MKSIKRVSEDNTIVYINANGKLHRSNGPAVIYANGDKSWYKDGELNRSNGPALIYTDPCGEVHQAWFKDGVKIEK